MELRIDELAQRAGTTSRNIRAYQARGLLPPPRLRGRTGYYGEDHLQRLEIIGQLQERGFSLESIRQILEAWSHGGDLGHLIGFHHLVTAPWTDEQPIVMSAEDLLGRFPEAAQHPELIEQAVDLGLVATRPDGTYDVPSPTLIEAGAELVRAGIPLPEIFELVKALRSDVADIAHRFIDIVSRHLVEPITDGTAAPERILEATEAVQRLRPVAMEVIRPFLAEELRRAIEQRAADLVARLEGA